jgi:phosphatidylinositol alpha-1,6-mannosyltransferase
MSQWSFSRADRVICVSNFTKQYMLKLGVQPKQAIVIPNGADATRFYLDSQRREAFRRKMDLSDTIVLLTVGSVTERKGHDIVIRSLPYILERVPNVHYLIAGLPRREAYLKDLANSLGVLEHVHFLGRVDEDALVDIYNASDIFVLTSRQTVDGDVEGYGIAVVEAALCGKPAVVSDNSGLAEAIIPNETGLIVEQEDVLATAQAIVTLCQDHALRQLMGMRARHRALNEQTWEYRAAQYELVLQNVLMGLRR